jgi:hypothetical protein
VGDVGVIHQGQRLPLRLEAGDDLVRVHAGLEHLQGHLAAHRLLLLGHEDHTEATFADLLQQLVGADDRAGPLRDGVGHGGNALFGQVEQVAAAFVGTQQGFDLGAKFRMAGAGAFQVSGTLRWRRQLQRS